MDNLGVRRIAHFAAYLPGLMAAYGRKDIGRGFSFQDPLPRSYGASACAIGGRM